MVVGQIVVVVLGGDGHGVAKIFEALRRRDPRRVCHILVHLTQGLRVRVSGGTAWGAGCGV